ncbi:hypothetical protein B0H19DRAFT_717270 [Mycena capillaripes]|nr:hypothetical protein B0H19DRAFT_717270 [Mycena capillaripes]
MLVPDSMAISYGIFLCIGTMSTYTLIRKGLRGQRARDIIVVWRAWVIWHENRIVHAALASEFQHVHYDKFEQNFLGTFGLLVTNFFSTALISYKLWYYRRNVKIYINRQGNGHTKVESVLILLMETGGIYCIFWILLMVGDFGPYYGPDFEWEWFQPNISKCSVIPLCPVQILRIGRSGSLLPRFPVGQRRGRISRMIRL